MEEGISILIILSTSITVFFTYRWIRYCQLVGEKVGDEIREKYNDI